MGSLIPAVDYDVGAGTLAEGFPALPLCPPMRRLRAGAGVFPWSAENYGTPVCGVGQSPWTSVLSTDTDPPRSVSRTTGHDVKTATLLSVVGHIHIPPRVSPKGMETRPLVGRLA